VDIHCSLKSDLQLAIVTLCGAIAVAALLSFALFRFARGQILIGAIDLFVIACIVSAGALPLRGRGRIAGNIVVAAVHRVADSARSDQALGAVLGVPGRHHQLFHHASTVGSEWKRSRSPSRC